MPLAQAVGRALGQGGQVFAGNFDDFGDIDLDLHDTSLLEYGEPAALNPQFGGNSAAPARAGAHIIYRQLPKADCTVCDIAAGKSAEYCRLSLPKTTAWQA